MGLQQGVTEQVPGLQDPCLTRSNEDRLGGVGHYGCGAVHYTLHRPKHVLSHNVHAGQLVLHLVRITSGEMPE